MTFIKPPNSKNPNPSGLGRAIINRRAKDARQLQGSGMVCRDYTSHPMAAPKLFISTQQTQMHPLVFNLSLRKGIWTNS